VEPIYLNTWPFRPDIVRENTERFNEQYGEKAEMVEITGDYHAIMTSKLQAKAPLDIFYGSLYHLARYASAGWLEYIDDLPTLEDYKRDVYPKYREAHYDPMTGHYYGLVYYDGWRTLLTNQAILEEAGMADDYPRNWDEVYENARELKRRGYTDTPLGLWWQADWWIGAEQFAAEHLNEGFTLIDENFEPAFEGTDYILQRWKDAYDEGLVPKELPAMSWGDYFTFLLSGKAAYFYTESYNIAVFNDPARSPYAGKCSLVPSTPKYIFGHTKGGDAYLVAKRPRDDVQLSRVFRFLSYLGYRDKFGELYVSKRWNLESYLSSVFPEVNEDPEVVAKFVNKATTYRGEVDYERYTYGFANAPYIHWWKAFWAIDFIIKIVERVPRAILGEVSIPETVEALRNDVISLKKMYGM